MTEAAEQAQASDVFVSLKSCSRRAKTASDKLFRRFDSARSFTEGKLERTTLSSLGQISSDVDPERVTSLEDASLAACVP